ncbi:hypothetical protein LJR220_001719 [Bradyrhizobium sp. LjRoot220]|uniref:hypothetical protein n=1 Tax=Bradyrhizobium sp. LjRoot220 TaxID=3342284 RepID=UPI003ECDF48F
MSGQIWLAQFPATEGLASRSALDNATASPVLTAGAKPASAITDVPSSASIANAEIDFIMLGC